MISQETGEAEASFNRGRFRPLAQGRRCRQHPASASPTRRPSQITQRPLGSGTSSKHPPRWQKLGPRTGTSRPQSCPLARAAGDKTRRVATRVCILARGTISHQAITTPYASLHDLKALPGKPASRHIRSYLTCPASWELAALNNRIAVPRLTLCNLMFGTTEVRDPPSSGGTDEKI